jgi:ABC-2 type transport system permease protein
VTEQAVPAPAPAAPSLRRAQWRGVGALSEREVVRMLRLWRQTIAPQVMSAVLFIVVFGVALGTRVGGIDGVDYEVFIVPGLTLMGVATSAFANNASSIFQARSDGFIEDPVSSPMSATQLTLSYLSGGVLRGVLIAVGTLAAARAFVDFPLAHPAYLAVVLVSAALGFAALGTVVGLYSRSFEAQAFVGSLVIQPLVFLGGVFYAIDALSQPWHSLTFVDPIFYAVVAARYGMLGTAEVSPWLAAGVTVALCAALVAWAAALFARGVGVRT